MTRTADDAAGLQTAILGRFAAEHPSAAIPEKIRAHAALMLLDILASAAGGRATALVRAAEGAGQLLFPGDAVGIWFGTGRLSPLGAAYVNSSATTALDIDDGHRGAAGHAGAAVVPAALACAEACGAEGAALLDAIVIGYDVALRIAAARRREHVAHWNSGIWAAYGAAAAAGRLMRLDAGQMAQALAIAGAEAPTSLPTGASARMGSTVKEGIPWATVTGLAAAARARAGGTGPDDLLDRAAIHDPALMTGDLGQRWEVTRTYLKPYACCRYIHSAIDAILAMRRPGAPVLSLTVEMFPEGLELMNARAPHSLEAAQYSFPFCTALAALRGAGAFQPMRAEALADPEVLALAARVEFRAGEAHRTAFPARTPATVTLDQGAGPERRTVEFPLGDVANPMPRSGVEEKLAALLPPGIPARPLIAAVDGLATGPVGAPAVKGPATGPVAALFAALAAPAPSRLETA